MNATPWLPAVLALLSACTAPAPTCSVPNTASLGPQEATGPLMRPGSNCLRCHSPGGEASGRVFSVGGTIFTAADSSACDGVEGVSIKVTDAQGKTVSMLSNGVGNFWSTTPLTPPLSMVADYQGRTVTMPVTAPTGGCALCHSWPDPTSASGRIRAP